MRRPPDPAATIATLQTALDRAHARIRELERTSATMAARMADANERADLAEMHLYTLQQAGRITSGVTPPFLDVSP